MNLCIQFLHHNANDYLRLLTIFLLLALEILLGICQQEIIFIPVRDSLSLVV